MRRFVTFHGVALNVFNDSLIDEALRIVYPCGLPGDTYQSLSNLYQKDLSTQGIDRILAGFENRLGNLFLSDESCKITSL